MPKNSGVGSLSHLQQMFLTQESNWGLLHCRQILYQLSYLQETQVQSLDGEDPWRRDRLPAPVFLGFPVAQLVKNLPAMQETLIQFLG